MPDISKNSTMLELLQAGATISFQGGYYLDGDVANKNIGVGTQFGPDGFWNMSEDGLVSALKDIAKMAENDGYKLDGKELVSGDDEQIENPSP